VNPGVFAAAPSVAVEAVTSAVAGVLASGLPLSVHVELFAGLEEWVKSSSGPLSLVTVFVYSFLIAFVLPGPSEVVLGVAETPFLGMLPYWLRLVVIIVVSGVGKALGSVVAFHVGQEAKHAGPIEKRVRDSRFDVYEWSEKTAVKLAKKYGYAGLAIALSVPFFPDTISIYAFAVLEEDYYKFAAATFAGSVGRLVVTIGLFAGGFAIGALPFTVAVVVIVGVGAAAWWLTRDDTSDEGVNASSGDDTPPPPAGEGDTPAAADGDAPAADDGDAPSPSTDDDTPAADDGDAPTPPSSGGDAPSPTSGRGDQD
jgi:membrane protein YqaA with SNARE-associated domain